MTIKEFWFYNLWLIHLKISLVLASRLGWLVEDLRVLSLSPSCREITRGGLNQPVILLRLAK